MATNQLTLAYWDIRGLVEPIKTLLAYLEIQYHYNRITSHEDWKKEKASATYLFPNLPYLVDGEKTITESEAIIIHVILKSGKTELLGKDADRVEFTQLKNVILDIQSAITGCIYRNKDIESMKEDIKAKVAYGEKKLIDLNEILGKRDWVMGYLTYVDFILAEIAERYAELDQEVGTAIISNYPNIKAHYQRFLELPQIKTYRGTDKFKARPHNGPSAAWY